MRLLLGREEIPPKFGTQVCSINIPNQCWNSFALKLCNFIFPISKTIERKLFISHWFMLSGLRMNQEDKVERPLVKLDACPEDQRMRQSRSDRGSHKCQWICVAGGNRRWGWGLLGQWKGHEDPGLAWHPPKHDAQFEWDWGQVLWKVSGEEEFSSCPQRWVIGVGHRHGGVKDNQMVSSTAVSTTQLDRGICV